MQRWLDLGHDQEKYMAEWARNGVPLGIKLPIPTCGIFPKGGDHLLATNTDVSDLSEVLLAPGENYVPCREHPVNTKREIDRNRGTGTCQYI